MKHIKVLELSEADRLKLEKGYHNGPTHNYRIRCKVSIQKTPYDEYCQYHGNCLLKISICLRKC